MPEATVFDAYRAKRALDGQLSDGDDLEVVAVDDISRDYWVLTKEELIVLRDDRITARIARATCVASVTTTATETEVRVRDSAPGSPTLIASFRRPNKFTERVGDMSPEKD